MSRSRSRAISPTGRPAACSAAAAKPTAPATLRVPERTDRSCPSLSPVDANGNAIYAVYLDAGRGQGEICRALGRAPQGAYAKVLDTTTPPGQATVAC